MRAHIASGPREIRPIFLFTPFAFLAEQAPEVQQLPSTRRTIRGGQAHIGHTQPPSPHSHELCNLASLLGRAARKLGVGEVRAKWGGPIGTTTPQCRGRAKTSSLQPVWSSDSSTRGGGGGKEMNSHTHGGTRNRPTRPSVWSVPAEIVTYPLGYSFLSASYLHELLCDSALLSSRQRRHPDTDSIRAFSGVWSMDMGMVWVGGVRSSRLLG